MWHYVTESADPQLHGQRGEITCLPNENPHVRGARRVDPAHPYHFLYEDGSRPFVLGYEANWLWALGSPASGASARCWRQARLRQRSGWGSAFFRLSRRPQALRCSPVCGLPPAARSTAD